MKRVVLVVGGSRGIGEACVREFARRGDLVVFSYHNSRGRALETEKELTAKGYDVHSYPANVKKFFQIQNLFYDTWAAFRSLDVLVNCAGISLVKEAGRTDDAEWVEVMDVNFGGVLRCCRQAIPFFLRKKKGVIVNISSMWGSVGASCESVYAASKGAVNAYTKSLAKELAPVGIRVNAVSPGVIDTEMNASLSEEDKRALCEETPLGRLGTPEEVASAVAFLASPEAEFITGQILGVNGGFVI